MWNVDLPHPRSDLNINRYKILQIPPELTAFIPHPSPPPVYERYFELYELKIQIGTIVTVVCSCSHQKKALRRSFPFKVVCDWQRALFMPTPWEEKTHVGLNASCYTFRICLIRWCLLIEPNPFRTTQMKCYDFRNKFEPAEDLQMQMWCTFFINKIPKDFKS